MASADNVNYSIRPNKTVERKIVFEMLASLVPVYDLSCYRYIGFGALWFVDFIFAHKYLLIADMISIERDEHLAVRAEFNKPYSCVSVQCGESEKILPQLSFGEKPTLAWLDYDTSLDGSVLEDISTLCRHAQTGSMMIVTLNAHKKSLPNQDSENREFQNDEERMRHYCNDLIPQPFPTGCMQTSKYPAFLASLVFMHIRRQVRKAGRENDQVVPLFNISYKDNAPMITVGAAIANKQQSHETEQVLHSKSTILRVDENKPLMIGVPPLTLKEKSTIDQLMPSVSVPSEHEVSQLGFRLKPSQIKAYHRFYRYYPMFGEVTI